MTVSVDQNVVVLHGQCGIEDAEALLALILDHPEAAVDWTRCTGLHTAVMQVILASRVRTTGVPSSAFLRDTVAPALAGHANRAG